MEAVDRLKLQIERLLEAINVHKEEGSELRSRLFKLEAESRAKDDYIKSLEKKLKATEGASGLKNLDAKG